MLRLGILPEGYIYPKEQRPVRDLLRKRGHLVKLRTSLILSLQGIISRNCGFKMNVNKIKKTTENEVYPVFLGQEDLGLSGEVSKETIDFLTRKIRKIETYVKNKVKMKKTDKIRFYVGLILALGSAAWTFFGSFRPSHTVVLIIGLILIATSNYRLLK